MSSAIILQTYDRLWIGADSAISSCIDGITYRWPGRKGQKLWVVDDSVIFCAGHSGLVLDVMDEYVRAAKRTVESLRDIVIKHVETYEKIHGECKDLPLSAIVCTYEEGRTVVYGIERPNGYEITARTLSNPGNFAIWAAGIKVQEASDAAMAKFQESLNVYQMFQHAFDEISYEGIGGDLTVYDIDKGVLSPSMFSQIKEKPQLRYLTGSIVRAEVDRLTASHVVAETVVGQLGNFVTMEIGAGNDVTKINTQGISSGHADFDSAPFRVNRQGDVVARSITLTGTVENSEVVSSLIRASRIVGNEIEGGTITGALLRTAAAGRRVEVNENGLRTYDAAGANRIRINTGSDNGVSAIVFNGTDGSTAGEINSYLSNGALNIISNNLFLGSNSTANPITLQGASRFQGSATFHYPVQFSSSVSGISVDVANVVGLSSQLGYLQTQIDNLNYRLQNHTHTVTTANHNHGNPQNQNSGGGTYTTSYPA